MSRARLGRRPSHPTVYIAGAYALVAYRSNTLAKLLCDVRDCFEHNGAITKLTKRMGPNANACFNRRKLPSSRRPPDYPRTCTWICMDMYIWRNMWTHICESGV